MLKKVDYPFFVESDGLTEREIEMRTFLMYDFNLSLKSMLYKYNPAEFDKWFFNCCRQTAIFGFFILNRYFPDYSFKSYEATMDDVLFGTNVQYAHCYIIATKKCDSNRKILIDMARTTNPLVFELLDNKHFYPEIENYKDLKIVKTKEINCIEMMMTNCTEYITGLPTIEALTMLEELIESYRNSKSKKKEELLMFYDLPFKKMEVFKKENNLLGFR